MIIFIIYLCNDIEIAVENSLQIGALVLIFFLSLFSQNRFYLRSTLSS